MGQLEICTDKDCQPPHRLPEIHGNFFFFKKKIVISVYETEQIFNHPLYECRASTPRLMSGALHINLNLENKTETTKNKTII